MSDTRFFRAAGPFTAGDIAKAVGAELSDSGRAGEQVRDIADLEQAGSGEISVFSDRRHAAAFAASNASVIVTNRKLGDLPHKRTLIFADDPRLAFARIGQLFYPRAAPQAFIHPRATLAASARLGDGSAVAAGAVIGENVIIGARAHIGANAVIADGVVIGDDVIIGPGTAISHALIGNKVTIAANVSIGGEGFGFVPSPKGLVKISQIGRVILEDGVEIGNNCAIDRGSLGDTVIGAMTAIDNLVQIGHNVKIGKSCVFAGQSGVAGSVTIGDFVMVGGGVSISDHLTIGTGAKIAGKSGVARDVAPGETVAGYPAIPVRQWHRQSAALAKLAQKKSGE